MKELEKIQKQMLFKLEEQTQVPYILMKKLLQSAETYSTSETTSKERISEYRALINKHMKTKEN
ncbi:hypothetical protein ACFSY7_06925 [Kurthia populi]|uniref:Uncharacterized protein n=1 Tax=Kurthia populi TaxID=1562132 RepID=A0ABW5XZ00_9BACL